MNLEREKQLAAEAALSLVAPGMTLGLGTGSTVAFLLAAIARRRIFVRCVASSPRTELAARQLGLRVEPFDRIKRLDLAIDGADQIAPDGWLLKGRGGAHLREKVIAAASERFVVIADSSKPVPALSGPVPVELLGFGIAATLMQLEPVTLRRMPLSPDGGLIADYQGPIGDPAVLAAWLEAAPGIMGHGLFSPKLVSEAWIGRGEDVERMVFRPLP